ncbi:MAG: hypothetical protein L6R35_004758 [Caloplaca aegaea]|nr:MAG: hypothetical protein L6R35_004758 [Caloplaca aegaea]
MFHRRRASSNPVSRPYTATIIHLTSPSQPAKTPPTAAASTAAVQAFLASRNSNANLSSAAAAAALRSRPTTPTPVGDIPTKRRAQRSGSVSSNGSARPTLQRQNSAGSMTERTFRDPSPSRANSANPDREEPPPVPALPKDYASPPPPVPLTSLRRPASVEPPERVTSPVPRGGGRGVSLDRGPGSMQHKQTKKKQPTHRSTVGEAERTQNRESINFSRPMSPQYLPPTSPLRELKAKAPAGQSPSITPTANMGVLRDGEADNIQHEVQDAASRPVKKKKKVVVKSMAEGSHFAGGGGAKPTGTSVETPSKAAPASVSSTPSPADSRVTASNAVTPTEPAPRKKKKKKKPVVSSERPEGSYASDSDSAMSDLSSSADRPRAFHTRAAGLLAKQPSIVREDREAEEQEEGQESITQHYTQNGSVTGTAVAPPSTSITSTNQSKKPADKPPMLSTAAESSPLNIPGTHEPRTSQPDTKSLDTPQPRRASLSPGRAAHFLAQPMYEIPDGVKHEPPARSVSPAKSALKHSPSSRGASPAGFMASGSNRFSGVAGSETSDNGSVISEEGGRMVPAKKKTARVSFDDDSVVVGRASTPPVTDSPTILSPQHKETGTRGFLGFGRRRKDTALDDGIKPTPTLPSFGSIRAKKNDEVGFNAPSSDGRIVTQRPLLGAQTSSDQVVGHVLSQDFASRKEPANEPSPSLQRPNDPLPPGVTSLEGSGYHSEREESDLDVIRDVKENTDVPAINDPVTSREEFSVAEFGPQAVNQTETKPVNMEDGSVPSIAILPATPGIGGNEEERDDWFRMPGGFGAANDETIVQQEPGAEDQVLVNSSNAIAAHHVTEPTPANLGISEPGPESTATSSSGSPIVGKVAEGIHQQTEVSNDDESDDTGNSIYSDAAEDISDLEGDGFGSINAIMESPIIPETSLMAGLATDSPLAKTPGSNQNAVRPAPANRNESERSEPPPEEGWDQAQAYWSGLSQSRKEQLERAAVPGAADKPLLQSDSANVAEEKPKQKKRLRKTAQSSDPPLPPWPDKEFRTEVSRPASSKAGGMKQSMRSSQPEVSQLHMRASMRNGVPPKSALRNSSQIPETKAATRGALRKKDRPVSAIAMGEYNKPNGTAVAGHTRASSMGVAPKTVTPVVPPLKKPPKPALRRATSDGSNSSSSFKKSRRPNTSDGGKYTMKRTMRGASSDARPQSAYGDRQTSLSARSASPPTRRPFSAAGPAGLGGMRTSMRDSIDSGVGSRTKSPPRAFGFGRPKQKQESVTAKKTGSRFASRFGDSSDEDEGPVKRQSRFVDSSDEEEEKSALTPVRGIPRRIDEGDSTDLEDSSNSPSPMIKADEKPPPPAAKTPEGSALATGSLRTGAAEQGNASQAKPAADTEKKKRFFFGSRRKQQQQQQQQQQQPPQSGLNISPPSPGTRKIPHPLEANYATPTGSPRSPKAPKFLSNDSPAAAAATSATASPKSQASPKPPKLQRRHTPKRFASDSWPVPEMPAAVAEKARMRPSTSDGAAAGGGGVVGKPLAVGSMRPQAGTRRFTAEEEEAPVNGAAGGKDAGGKKKRFPMLRKALGL